MTLNNYTLVNSEGSVEQPENWLNVEKNWLNVEKKQILELILSHTAVMVEHVRSAPTDRFLLRVPSFFLVLSSAFQTPSPV